MTNDHQASSLCHQSSRPESQRRVLSEHFLGESTYLSKLREEFRTLASEVQITHIYFVKTTLFIQWPDQTVLWVWTSLIWLSGGIVGVAVNIFCFHSFSEHPTAHPWDPRLEIDSHGGRQVAGKAGQILILQQLDNRHQQLNSLKHRDIFFGTPCTLQHSLL